MSDIQNDECSKSRDSGDQEKKMLATIGPHAPIRLETAAKIAFPDGSVNVRMLRKQVSEGRLAVWHIGGRHFTSLNEIEKMINKCRVTPSLSDRGIESQDAPEKIKPCQVTEPAHDSGDYQN
jgi:hypothetical protein